MGDVCVFINITNLIRLKAKAAPLRLKLCYCYISEYYYNLSHDYCFVLNMIDYIFVTKILKQGGIIAYPTEAVFGLGCNPFNQTAVNKLLQLKQRDVAKGLILIASSWEQVKSLVTEIPEKNLTAVLASWPGPHTWLFPANEKVPYWIKGEHSSVALRITAHPIAKAICAAFGGPVVSTSANVANLQPAKTAEEVLTQFPQGIDYIVPGDVGSLLNPTPIRDALTSKILR